MCYSCVGRNPGDFCRPSPLTRLAFGPTSPSPRGKTGCTSAQILPKNEVSGNPLVCLYLPEPAPTSCRGEESVRAPQIVVLGAGRYSQRRAIPKSGLAQGERNLSWALKPRWIEGLDRIGHFWIGS